MYINYLAGKITVTPCLALFKDKNYLMVRSLLFLLLLLNTIIASAQFNYVLDQSIPVQNINGDPFLMPWAGGINAPQYNTLDLNGDAKDDLVLFDRMADKVLTYINQNDQYRYAPEYEILFPQDITRWILLRDYNCDGKKDLFSGDNLGIKVYMNTTIPGGNISWKKFLFYDKPNKPKSPVLLTLGSSAVLVNLQMQFDDLPSIDDFDGDGDIDIMSMRYVGEGSVALHKNFSIEEYETCDSLKFKSVTQTWGSFKECECGTFAFNGTSCPPHGGRTQHAGGKSLLALDVDGDADLDLLLSEASCNNLYLLKNVGTTEVPVINTHTIFPTNEPVNFYIFPAAFFEDVDSDGVKDLIATPNIYSKVYFNSNLGASNLFYKNTGTTQSPNFDFIKSNLLQEDMIEVGNNAVPAFADYDDDGDFDMFISQHAGTDAVARISLFENIGAVETPLFKLLTNDYLNQDFLNLYNMKIQFADLNANGKTDLVFTATSSEGTKLYFIESKSESGLDFSGQIPQPIDIALSYADNVCVIKVNSDGLPDLLIGKNNGSLAYWKNNGSLNFIQEDSEFLGLGSGSLEGNAACAVGDLNADGEDDIVITDKTGRPRIISNFRIADDDSESFSEIVYSPITETYYAHNLGDALWPSVVNLFNTNTPVVVVGNTLGGVQVLRNDAGYVLPKEPVISLFPNPVKENNIINIKVDRPAYLQIYSLLGQKIAEPVKVPANQINEYKGTNLTQGLYLFHFTISNKCYTKRIVIN